MPDYQLLSVFAKALDDTSAYVLTAYNSRNPGYTTGQALDLLLPLYGIAREAGGIGRFRSRTDERSDRFPGDFHL